MSTEEKMSSEEENNKIENMEASTETTSNEINSPKEEVVNPTPTDSTQQEVADVEAPVVVQQAEPVINQEEPNQQEEKDFVEPAEIKEHAEVEAKLEEVHLEDYSLFNKTELIKKLEEVLTTDDVESVKKNVKNIKSAYQLLLKEEYDAKLRAFFESGGKKEEFSLAKDANDEQFETLMSLFNHKRIEQRKLMEKQLEENHEEKKRIIDELKTLLENEPNVSLSVKKLHELQNRWRAVGYVPQQYVEDLWRNYQYYINKFYDILKINFEFRDLDNKKNLELKTELCEKAEDLLLEPSINKSLKSLRVLQEKWRTIGPVKRDQQEVLWERFKTVCDKVYDRAKEYLAGKEEEFKVNLDAKTAIVEKLEGIANGIYHKANEWKTAQEESEKCLDEWKKTGHAPKEKADLVWKRFRAAMDKFYDEKGLFFKGLKQNMNHNVQLKTDIVNEAEAMKDSTNWKDTGEIMKKLQEKWKTIGPVPENVSEKLWKRFRKACDTFFENRQKHFGGQDEKQQENLKLKQELVTRIENYQISKDNADNIAALKEFQNEWMSIEFVPFKEKEKINKAYREAVDKKFEGIVQYTNEGNRNFKSNNRGPIGSGGRDNSFKGGGGNKGNYSRNEDRYEPKPYGVSDKIKDIEKELAVLENNILFFGKSKNADKLKEEIQQKIDKFKSEIDGLKKAAKKKKEEKEKQVE
jgi:hypothetical protein